MKAFRYIFVILFLILGLNLYGNDISKDDIFQDAILQDAILQDTIKIKFSESTLIIENLPKDDVLEIYNIMGAKVYTRRIKSGTNEYQITLPRGYYIIKIGKFTKKIAVR